MSITLDNASNNTSAIGKLKLKYEPPMDEAGKSCLSPNWNVPTRWNSTYHMFQCGLKQRSTLMYFYDLLASKELLIESISTDLEFFYDGYATKAKNGSPTLWKDHLDAQERKQDKSSIENAVDFEEEILDAEGQQNEAIPLSEEEITLDVASSEGTMSGSGSGGEEVDYDMTNYGDGDDY
nr:cytochrome P450 [Tanacetum cinerariifolium]